MLRNARWRVLAWPCWNTITSGGPDPDSALEAGHDLRDVEAQLQLHANVFALLARQRAAGFDAHVLGLEDADDLRQRRTDGIGPVTRFAEGSAEESFNVHGRSWSCGGCIVRHAGKCGPASATDEPLDRTIFPQPSLAQRTAQPDGRPQRDDGHDQQGQSGLAPRLAGQPPDARSDERSVG